MELVPEDVFSGYLLLLLLLLLKENAFVIHCSLYLEWFKLISNPAIKVSKTQCLVEKETNLLLKISLRSPNFAITPLITFTCINK